MQSADSHGAFTVILYRMSKDRSKEPVLNRLAAWATNSEFTHVEIAIGSTAGADGQMTNVLRVFNDNVGVVRQRACPAPRRSRQFACRAPLLAGRTACHPCACPGAGGANRSEPEL